MVKIVEFSNKRNQFQAELKSDVDKIKQCPDILLFTDKTGDFCKMNTKTTKSCLKKIIQRHIGKRQSN